MILSTGLLLHVNNLSVLSHPHLRHLQDVWQQAREGQIDPLALKELLEGIRDTADVPLSVRSLRYLGLDTQDMEEFVSLHKQQPIRRQVTAVA